MERPHRIKPAVNVGRALSDITPPWWAPWNAFMAVVLTVILAVMLTSGWVLGQEASKAEVVPSLAEICSLAEIRSVAEIHRQLRRLEAETAKLDSDTERAENIAALCGLFVEIGEHPELHDSLTLQSLSVRLRTRLRGIDRRTVNELRRRQIPEPPNLLSPPTFDVVVRPNLLDSHPASR